jgi:hypothetical protein
MTGTRKAPFPTHLDLMAITTASSSSWKILTSCLKYQELMCNFLHVRVINRIDQILLKMWIRY